MGKMKKNAKEVDTESVDYVNEMVDEAIHGVILEAVKHFSTSRPRTYEDDARYFYNKKELESFWAAFSGDKGKLSCKKILDDTGKLFCFEIARVH